MNNKRLFPRLPELWYIPFFWILLFPVSFLGLCYLSDKIEPKSKGRKYFFAFLAIIQLGIGVLGVVRNQEVFYYIFVLIWFFTFCSMIRIAKKDLESHIINKYISSKPSFKQQKLQSNKTPSVITTTIETKNQANVERMGNDLINKLNKWKKEVEPVEMKQDISQIIELCTVVMKRDDEKAAKFFRHYTDPLDNMLGKYDEIENTHLNTPEMKKTMRFIEKSVADLVHVIRNEVNQMYKDDMLHLNAETHVFMQNLKNKGLFD